jgi:hypothetical protein
MSFCMYTAEGDFDCNEDSNKGTIEHFGASRWDSNPVRARERTVNRWTPVSPSSYTPTARYTGPVISSCYTSRFSGRQICY